MLLQSLKLKNFGLFRGENEFGLKSSGDKPVILFGGKNGSGKTTLFEAIKLCLYGIKFRGKGLYSSQYENYIKNRLNRDFSGNEMYVEIKFLHSKLGERDEYSIKRKWTVDENKFDETLHLRRNGKKVDEMEKDQWDDFIAELIPYGISNLFFFDGEKIQDLAHDDDNMYLLESFNTLLGLDIVERLQADLNIYVSKHMNGKGNGKLEKELEYVEDKEKSLEMELERLVQKKASTQSQIDHTQSKIQRQEQKIASEGGGYATKRENLKNRIHELDIRIENVEDEIRNLVENLFPFSILPELCKRLKDRIQLESELQHTKSLKKKLEEDHEKLVEHVISSNIWKDVSGINKAKKEKLTRSILKNIIELNSEYKEDIFVHNFSPPQSRKMISWIDLATKSTPSQINGLSSRLENMIKERQRAEGMLLKAPSDDVMAPLVEKLNKLYKELGNLQAKKNSIEEDVSKIKNLIIENQRRKDSIVEKIDTYTKENRRFELTDKIKGVLSDYSEELRRQKIGELSKIMLRCFNELYRKNNFIEKISISPESFDITLYDNNSSILKRDNLSAGEKQIYAIAVLWALAQSSGRRLPFIIDTPLARLDFDHRENIVENFFPNAGNQVLIFSTDTEIDKKYFEVLKPYISKTYKLEYDNTSRKTDVSEGYLWKIPAVKNEIQ